MAEHMLTTVDNPFSPLTDHEAWYAWDTTHGYHTLSLLARVVRSTDEMTDAVVAQAAEDAILEIARENVSGMHRLVEIPGT